ncbi:MAG: hypothetical protein WAM95_07080 [Bacillus sp. (in: firmicutes)]|jgi:hypothetical protein
MNQEEVEIARNTLVANLILLGGITLLFIGNSLAVAIAYRDYQKSLTATPQPIEATPTL